MGRIVHGPILVARRIRGEGDDPARIERARERGPSVVAGDEREIKAALAAQCTMVCKRRGSNGSASRRTDGPRRAAHRRAGTSSRSRIRGARALLDERGKHDRVAQQKVMRDEQAAHLGRTRAPPRQRRRAKNVEPGQQPATHVRRADAGFSSSMTSWSTCSASGSAPAT